MTVVISLRCLGGSMLLDGEEKGCAVLMEDVEALAPKELASTESIGAHRASAN